MTTTPTYPLTDDIKRIDRAIADLQRDAQLAQSDSNVSARAVAIAKQAIRDLIAAKKEIQEKERLWDRTSQLKRALAERKTEADLVRAALADGGSLAEGRKTALEAQLKDKAGINDAEIQTMIYSPVDTVKDTTLTEDIKIRDALETAATALTKAEQEYATKAKAAEAAWENIHRSATQLNEQLSKAQRLLAEATQLTNAVDAPEPVARNPEAAEAGVACKDFVDLLATLKSETTFPPSSTDDHGQQELVGAWETARNEARNALAVLLVKRQELTQKLVDHQLRQAPRPDRSAEETAEVLEAVQTALSPPGP